MAKYLISFPSAAPAWAGLPVFGLFLLMQEVFVVLAGVVLEFSRRRRRWLGLRLSGVWVSCDMSGRGDEDQRARSA